MRLGYEKKYIVKTEKKRKPEQKGISCRIFLHFLEKI